MRHRKVQKYDGQDWSDTGLHFQSWWLFVKFKYICNSGCLRHLKVYQVYRDDRGLHFPSWGLFLNSKCLANSTTLNRLWQWVLFDFFLIYHLEIACELWVFDQVCPACLPVRSLKEMEVQFNSKTWIGSFNFNFHFSDQIYVESLTWTIQIEVENQHQFHFLVSVA